LHALLEDRVGEADPVVASDGATAFQIGGDDLGEGGFDAVHLGVVAFVGEDRGVQVAVAEVAKGSDVQVVFFCDGFDGANHAGQLAAEDGDVFENGGGAETARALKALRRTAASCVASAAAAARRTEVAPWVW